MDLVDHRASEAIAVESRAIEELEIEERRQENEVLVADAELQGLALHLSPST